jgi:GTP cyclohydrolase I
LEKVLDGLPILESAHLDLANTPMRVARMYYDELLSSYRDDKRAEFLAKLTTFDADGYNEIVMVADVPFASLCAHHMLPFVGVAHVGYIPRKRIVGLSKIPRIVDFFSHKLQTQERLTLEVADFFVDLVDPAGVFVVMEASHYCMIMRGVQKAGSITSTAALRGVATRPDVKSEFNQHLARVKKTS